MAILTFDASGERIYENGVDHGVLYPFVAEPEEGDPSYGPGVAWNGLTAVTESPSGAEPTALWADNIKYLNLMSVEEFALTLEAYTYPDEFAPCEGYSEPVTGVKLSQQTRASFGLSYRTKVGDDTTPDKGYKLHLVYGCLAAPSERGNATINDSPEAITFSWEVKTTPVTVADLDDQSFKPVAHIVIESLTADADCLALLEAALYGEEAEDPYLPLPDEVITMMTPTGP